MNSVLLSTEVTGGSIFLSTSWPAQSRELPNSAGKALPTGRDIAGHAVQMLSS